jgi:cytochrome c oxidase assembly protein subunit 11
MRRTTRTAVLLGLLVFGMTGLAFASVPLYRVFCELTGFAGTPQRAEGGSAPGAVGRTIGIRFDANTSGLPWQFRPVDQHRTVPIGARNIALYTARNDSRHAVTGQATFNVTPSQAGRYFTKIQCFCFTEQTLAPGQEVQMPVTFYVDPAILDDPDARNISEITLSYTFYPVDRRPSGS